MPKPSTNGQRSKVIDAKLARLPAKFKRCRSGRHAYDDFISFRHDHTDGRRYIVVLFPCTRCDFERWDFYDSKFEFQFSRPRYPDGYLLKWGAGEERVRISSRDATRHLLRSATVKILDEVPKARRR